jgi:hypothetical protein
MAENSQSSLAVLTTPQSPETSGLFNRSLASSLVKVVLEEYATENDDAPSLKSPIEALALRNGFEDMEIVQVNEGANLVSYTLTPTLMREIYTAINDLQNFMVQLSKAIGRPDDFFKVDPGNVAQSVLAKARSKAQMIGAWVILRARFAAVPGVVNKRLHELEYGTRPASPASTSSGAYRNFDEASDDDSKLRSMFNFPRHRLEIPAVVQSRINNKATWEQVWEPFSPQTETVESSLTPDSAEEREVANLMMPNASEEYPYSPLPKGRRVLFAPGEPLPSTPTIERGSSSGTGGVLHGMATKSGARTLFTKGPEVLSDGTVSSWARGVGAISTPR